MDGNILCAMTQDQGAEAGSSLAFCTGFGQADTHSQEIIGRDGQRKPNTHPSAGKDYRTITPKEVVALVENPLCEDKSKAQWIRRTYNPMIDRV